MLPKPGMDVAQTAARLQAMAVQVRNIESGGIEPGRYATAYTEWVHALERELRSYFTEVPMERLYTERFWRINAREGAQPWSQLREEIETQVLWLERTADAIHALLARLGPSRAVAVPDTHVLLHYKPLSDIDWTGLLGVEAVRVVIPLRVVDELDEKKYARRGELGDRARSVVRQLSRYMDGPGELRSGVELVVIGHLDLDQVAYRRPRPPADVEILDACVALAAYSTPSPVSLVTGDLGMQIRARDRGVAVTRLDERFLIAAQAEPGST